MNYVSSKIVPITTFVHDNYFTTLYITNSMINNNMWFFPLNFSMIIQKGSPFSLHLYHTGNSGVLVSAQMRTENDSRLKLKLGKFNSDFPLNIKEFILGGEIEIKMDNLSEG